jgi:hypothetical protein
VVDDDAPPPAELRLEWLCGQAFLPEPGGMLDQDAGLMARMRASGNVYRALSHYRNAHGAEIHHLSLVERKILAGLKAEGLL